ncbi:unnamed protein product [Protopolystoma xenopodis]|uniref:Uncharacterized protein n=1 Tax=Protopolystoma xenopodis TaxID=117903 RepID=A0A448XKX2_9PLAT|nr:unnamed protein product [Protopolystoma xenopodis]
MPETNDLQIVSCSSGSDVRLTQLTPAGASERLKRGENRLLVRHRAPCHKLALPAGEPTLVLSCGEDGRVFSIDLRRPRPDK